MAPPASSRNNRYRDSSDDDSSDSFNNIPNAQAPPNSPMIHENLEPLNVVPPPRISAPAPRLRTPARMTGLAIRAEQHTCASRRHVASSQALLGVPIGRHPQTLLDPITTEGFRQLHEQNLLHEVRMQHHQSLIEQLAQNLAAAHQDMQRARDRIEEINWSIRNLRVRIIGWGIVVVVLVVIVAVILNRLLG